MGVAKFLFFFFFMGVVNLLFLLFLPLYSKRLVFTPVFAPLFCTLVSDSLVFTPVSNVFTPVSNCSSDRRAAAAGWHQVCGAARVGGSSRSGP